MKKNDVWRLILIIGIIFTAYSFFSNIKYVTSFMNTSLYNRYIAVKIAKIHYDPYFFKWNPNSPKEIFDPLADSNIRINRIYASPAVILFFYPFSALKFSTLKMIWMLLEWLFIILAILLLANSSNIDANKRMIFAILLVCCKIV